MSQGHAPPNFIGEKFFCGASNFNYSFTLDSFHNGSLMSISLLFLLLIWKKYWFFNLISFLKKTSYFPLWRSLSSFTLLKPNFKADLIFKVPLLPFTSVFFTLLKPNFKTDPISKVPLLPFTSVGFTRQ
ncbi:hypothetical protein GLOIN_2v1847556 [Rhizophagus irregularis DAOM 181602=DAOM 197198]|nr:hypothetical protein GLOIN_2v1847556 [Rhizophagus irregularis DAOM 181602=DAOM 197198]